MIYYQIYQSQLKDSPSFGKYYARVISTNTLHVEELAQHMASHSLPMQKDFIAAVINATISCIKELCLDGKRVILDDLVSFGLSIKHKMGADTADDFSVAKNVDSVVLQAIGLGSFSKAMRSQQAKLRESGSYVSPRSSNVNPDETPDNGGSGGGGDNTDEGEGGGSLI